MRSILDTCAVCQIGRLLPRTRSDFFPRVLGRLEPIGLWPNALGRTPHSDGPVLDFLSCNVCGLRYDARDAGRTFADLRRTVLATATEIPSIPTTCPHCHQGSLATEALGNPDDDPGIVRAMRALYDPRDFPNFVYCPTCNSVLGKLPIDPAAIASYEQRLAQMRTQLAQIS